MRLGQGNQMTHIFKEKEVAGPIAQYVTGQTGIFKSDDLTVMALPPGVVDLRHQLVGDVINLSAFGGSKTTMARLNGEKTSIHTDSLHELNFYGVGSDFELKCTNSNWECLLEFAPGKIKHLLSEQVEGTDLKNLEFGGAIDQSAGVLAQLAVNHLRLPTIDKLYIEGLAIALMSRTVKLVASDSKLPSAVGTDRRIDRAIDYIHTHLLDTLTVSDMASVACMSPSWFSRVFKERTGLSVHAYVLEKRLERAMMALSTTKDPIANIAFACGFADHSHLTRTFRKRYGATRSEVRAD